MTQLMEIWQAWVAWSTSPEGLSILGTTVLPFLAILASGIFAAIIARGGMSRLARRQDQAESAAVVAAALAAARRAGAWGTMSVLEQEQVEGRLGEAFARLRMLPTVGADAAADWGRLKADVLKRTSLRSTTSAEIEVRELEDELIRWYRRPRRTAKALREELPGLRMRAAAPTAVPAADEGLTEIFRAA